MIIISQPFEGYQKTHKHCDGKNVLGEVFSSLKLAQSACSSNQKCSGVLDVGCRNANMFYLCSASKALEPESSNALGSCVYVKGI